MNTVFILLGFIGMVLVPSSVIYLLYSLIKKNGKAKKAGLGILAGVILFIVGATMMDDTNLEENKEPSFVQKEETDKKDKEKDETDTKAKEKEEADKKAKEKEEADKKAKEKEEADKKAKEKEEANKETLSQKNAVRAANNYLNFTAFSRTGLIAQLEFEDYSNEDAVYAVDKIIVDWNEQAALSAQNYLDFTSFSKQGLIDQLLFEGYTKEQAIYGVEAVGF